MANENKSNETKHRNMEEIGTDYQRLALKAGDLSFKISAFKKDLSLVQDEMQKLNFEALAVQRALEANAKTDPATAPTPAPNQQAEQKQQVEVTTSA